VLRRVAVVLVGLVASSLGAVVTAGPAGADAAATPSGGLPRLQAASFDAGGSHTCAITGSLSLVCFGLGASGQLGISELNQGSTATIGDDEVPSRPAVVFDGSGREVAAVSAGGSHTCAVRTNGQVRCWGANASGQLGYGFTDTVGDTEAPLAAGPVDLGPAPGVGRTAAMISAGGTHTCAVLDNGTVRCWGEGSSGQLGLAATADVGDTEVPASVATVDVGTGRTAVAVTAGAAHSCVILDDGSVRCWGEGSSGQLGLGTSDDIGETETPGSVPVVDLGPGRTAVAIAAGGAHTCAVLDDGSVRCWGAGSSGQLGLASTVDIGDTETPGSVPVVDLGAGRTALAITAGDAHTCVETDLALLSCWGANASGQHGRGDVRVVGDDEAPGTVPAIEIGPYGQMIAVPGAPTNVRATFSMNQLYNIPEMAVTWDPPAITGGDVEYTVTRTAEGGSPVVEPGRSRFDNLARGVRYTFTVQARNAAGLWGPVSAPSASYLFGFESGYWLLQDDGEVHAFGVPDMGDARADVGAFGGRAVDLSTYAGSVGYAVLLDGGQVANTPSSGYLDPGSLVAGERAVGIATRPNGGYWITTNLGRVAGFGGAPDLGGMQGTPLNAPIIDIVATTTGAGYYLLAADGGVFSFGDAVFHGSTGAMRLNQPVVGMAVDPDGSGYWFTASDGGVFAFDADFRGSMGAVPLNQPVRGMASRGEGYVLVAQDGGIFDFSGLPFAGSLGGNPPATPIVAATA
jgi:alpha-tubulin suppressor-like RCC1 family protein